MISPKTVRTITLLILAALAIPMQAAAEFSGLARVGYIYVDEEGNQGVHQGSFNLYEGAAVSFEGIDYRAANGLRLTGNLRNITLNNRNLSLNLGKRGKFGVSLNNSQYRRVYSSQGGDFTRRHRTRTNLWVQPHRHVKLFGGFGLTGKTGHQVRLFDPGMDLGRNQVDYTQTDFNAGVDFRYEQYKLRLEYRGLSFSDDLASVNDRTSVRYEVSASGPVPKFEQVQVYGGFQRYVSEVTERNDSLIANTAWGGARYFAPKNITLSGNFIFDRARRKGDVTATDNIAYRFRAGKDWRGYGGVVLGYGHHIRDDVFDELSSDSYSISAWGRPIEKVLIRGGFGSEAMEVQSGRTLTGDQDRTRYRFSARYDIEDYGYVRVKHSNRDIENDQIGSSAEFMQTAVELSLRDPEYGELTGSYSLFDGEYVNSDGVFGFKDHVLAWDVFTREYRKLKGGFGGTYMRGKEDVDIESFTLRFTGIYNFVEAYQFMLRYTAHNFDDLDDPSPIYSRYYTANVVEISVARRF